MPGKIAFFFKLVFISKFKTLLLVFKQCWKKNRDLKWVNIGLRWYRLLKFLLNRNSGKLFTTLVKPIWKNRQGNSAAAAVVGEHSKKAFSFFIYIFSLSCLFVSMVFLKGQVLFSTTAACYDLNSTSYIRVRSGIAKFFRPFAIMLHEVTWNWVLKYVI